MCCAGKAQYCVWLVMVIILAVDAMSKNEIDKAVRSSLLKGENSLQQRKEELRQFRMNGNRLIHMLYLLFGTRPCFLCFCKLFSSPLFLEITELTKNYLYTKEQILFKNNLR